MQGPLLGEVAAQALRTDPGGYLLRLLADLPLEGLERSFKLSAGTVLDDRYLIGIHKSGITPARLFAVCDAMGMPGKFREEFRARAQEANAFHFGFEGRGAGGLYKVYLEFAQGLQPGATAPFTLHRSYKWDCIDPGTATIALYTCHPGLGVEGIAARLAGMGATNAAGAILRSAAALTGEPLMYLEVGEEGNPRASYDLNLHAAGIHIGEIRDDLLGTCARLSIPRERFEPLYQGARDRTLGHLSGGTDREGREFLTVYYPVERL